MSGHNKWSKIKDKKAITDVKKSRVFGKIAKLIASESRRVKGDTSSPSLRAAIAKAKELNMPSDNIDRAVKKGLGEEATAMEEVVYEAYGPGGAAIVILGLTDSKNRSSAEIKHLLSKHGTSLSASGSAIWAFEKIEGGLKPKTAVTISEDDGKKLSLLVEELENHDDVQEVFVNTA